ncbi:hypothetical protein [Roseitranquillus sediminis]|uniref:hypothetical protein n=1 Tax=Roseitranquillus sediminis TaxID=2809051 RepID=UPI001D0C48C7|nr:hypothetical protein [Roseitranquillus sediminis]MBM9594838.1 hypothetical protein [Roseitranquillus sediminis]
MSDKDRESDRPEREVGQVPPGGDASTTDRLRRDIDRGESGDKIGHSDPASAPLGTDAEAGGDSPTREEVRQAHEAEVEHRANAPTAAGARPIAGDDVTRPRDTHPQASSGTTPTHDTGTKRNWTMWIVAAVVVLLLLWIIF